MYLTAGQKKIIQKFQIIFSLIRLTANILSGVQNLLPSIKDT